MRLLVVSHDFHPAERIGAFRISGLARYLPAHAIEVHVLAGAQGVVAGTVPLADALSVQAPSGAMARSRVSYLPGGRPRRSLAWRDRLAQPGAGGPARRLLRRALSAYAFFTYAEHRGWVEAAVRCARDAGRGCDVVLGTYGGEYWNLGAAHGIARRLGVPLVLDLRDGWDWFHGFCGRRSPVYPLMRRYVATSRLAVCATPSVADRLLEFWPHARTAVVANGFDPSIEPAPTGPGSDHPADVTVGHFGTLWDSDRWGLVAQALSELGRARSVRVVYRGRNRDAFEREVMARCADTVAFDLGDSCPRAEARRLVTHVDVVVCATSGRYPGAVPTKIDEAIGLAKPFIVLEGARPGRLREHLEGCPTPHLLVGEGTTLDAVRDFLASPPRTPGRDDPRLARYSIEGRAAELAQVLRSV